MTFAFSRPLSTRADRNENNSQGVRDMHRLLSMRLRARDLTVLRLDHLGNSDRISVRGSSSKGLGVDQSWWLTQRAGESQQQALSRVPAVSHKQNQTTTVTAGLAQG